MAQRCGLVVGVRWWVECGDAGEDQGDAREEFGLVVVVA